MLILVIAMLAANVVTADPICEPGEIDNRGHAVCACANDGTAWDCSLVADAHPREGQQTITQVCRPYDTKMESLLACYCLEDGSAWSCNSVSNSPLRKRRYSAVRELCLPGDKKTTGLYGGLCHSCSCLSDSSGWACQLGSCRPRICSPGKTEKRDCNTCTCDSDGYTVSCTNMDCAQRRWRQETPWTEFEQLAEMTKFNINNLT